MCVAIYCLHIIGGCALAFGALATPAQQIIVASQVADLDPGNKSSFPSDLVNVHGTLFFKANTDTFSYSLWAAMAQRRARCGSSISIQAAAVQVRFI